MLFFWFCELRLKIEFAKNSHFKNENQVQFSTAELWFAWVPWNCGMPSN
jgi:hypothetical protein